MKKTATTFVLFFFFVFFTRAQDTTNYYLISHYKNKINTYLDKQGLLSGHYQIDKQGIKIYASAENKQQKKVEFEINYSQISDFNALLKKSSDEAFTAYLKGKYISKNTELQKKEKSNKLKGYKIAIDPGHIAYNFEIGDLEKKYLKFEYLNEQGKIDSIEIAEGVLTYATAIILKEKLEKEGAEVFITRKNGTSAFGKTFEQWKKDDYQKAIDSLYKIGELKAYQKNYFLSDKVKDRDIFRVIFKDLDLAKRAELINKFKPDFSVIIHYNVDETNLEWKKTTDKNYNMTFIGGAFMKNDLSSTEKRFEFLRMLISTDIEESIKLSSATIKTFETILQVKTAGINDANYLQEGCLKTNEKGVFCRNLQLTRYIHGPLVYGETLYQDNKIECQLLNKQTDKTKNDRVKQVAEAYYQGIINYISSK